MADIPLLMLPHRVTAEPFGGDGSEGVTYRPPVAGIPCRQDGVLTVNADGQHVGSVKLYARRDRARLFALGSRVTLLDGTVGTVTAFADHADGGMGAWQHLELVVTA